MNHFNFFENARKEKGTLNIPLISAMILIGGILISGGIYASARIELSDAERHLAYLSSVEEDPVFRKQYDQVKQLERSLTKSEENYVFLRAADWLTEQNSTVSEALVKSVAAFFPAGTKIIKLSVSQNDLSVEGVAEDLQTMIRVEKSLKASRNFSYVFIDSAKQDSHTGQNGKEAVSFSCRLKLSQNEKGRDNK